MAETATPSRIYIDTSILLDAFESASPHAGRLRLVLKGFASKPRLVVTSEFTLAEVLGKEAKKGWGWQSLFYPTLLASDGAFDIRPLTRDLLIATGAFRKAARDAGRSAGLGDAIHAVTAIDAACTHLFTGDKRFVVPQPIARLTLDDADLAAIEQLVDA